MKQHTIVVAIIALSALNAVVACSPYKSERDSLSIPSAKVDPSAPVNNPTTETTIPSAPSGTGGGTGGSGGEGGGGGTTAPVPSFIPDADTPSSLFNWVGILGTGQSLSVGAAAGATLFTGASYNNLKLYDSSGNYNSQGATLSAVPLTEPLRPLSNLNSYPNNIYGETYHGTMASTMTELSKSLALRDLISAHTAAGYSGAGMSGIAKGGNLNSYASGIFEANSFKNLAAIAGKTFGYGAVILTHGETDWASPGYAQTLLTMYNDYNQDLKAITGQIKDIPLFISQQHTFPNTASGYFQNIISTQNQWLASLDSPSKIILVGPKYQYSYSDSVHLTAAGYEDYGKKLAEVYYRVTEKKEVWKPLQPNSAKVVDSTTIRIAFDVPVPPLQFNMAMTPPHQTANPEWANGKGFELLKFDGTKATISSVSISSSTTVDIVVAAGTSAVRTVQYASTQDLANGFTGGSPEGRFGLLTDSDTMVNQVNFCIAFVLPVLREDAAVVQLKGRATDLAFDGTNLWNLGDVWTSAGGGGLNMNIQYRNVADEITTLPSSAATRIDISNAGLIVASIGDGLGYYRAGLGGSWTPFNLSIPNGESIYDLGVGGTPGVSEYIWVTSTVGTAYVFINGAWAPAPSTLFDMDVDTSGFAWGFDASGRLQQWNGAAWIDRGIDGLAISVGSDNTVYIVKKSDRNIYHLPNGSNTWVQDTTSGGFDKVQAGAPGVVYMTNGERIFKKQ